MKFTIKYFMIVIINIVIIVVSFITYSCSLKETDEIEFIGGTKYSFGNVKCDDIALCTFQYKNLKGDELVIDEVKTSCGCTVSNWSKRPIKQDSIGHIDVTYLARMPGVFDQSISIYFHESSKPIVLKINGYVQDPEIKVVEKKANEDL